MTSIQSAKTLPWLLGVLVLAAAFAIYSNIHGRGAPTRVSGPAQTALAGPSQAQPAKPAPGAAVSAPGAATPASGVSPSHGAASAMRSAKPSVRPATGVPAAGGATGRPDPFAPLVVEKPPSPPSAPSVPASGIGLPLPPGFAGPGKGAPLPSPAAGMTVTGIVGGTPNKVAIIQELGRSFIVGVGENVDGAVVMSIETDKVVLRKDGVTFSLPLGGERSS